MLVDLHTHSRASDGVLSPPELLAAAVAAGIGMLSITDHDTIAGYASLPGSLPTGLLLVPGIELSARWRSQGVHILGLNVAPGSAAMREAVCRQQQVRQDRAVRIAAKLERLGIDGALQGATAIAGGGNLGRPHFAEFLVAAGVVSTFAEAFDRFLRAGKPGAVREQWPSLGPIVEWIRGAGGTAVLAHPAKYRLTRTKLDELTRDFGAAGGAGIEVISGRQVPAVTRDLARLANAHGMDASAGSDFHRPGQDWAALGRCGALPGSCTPVWDRW